MREVSAYLLDHGSFAGVPATSLVELRHQSLSSSVIRSDQVTDEVFLELIQDLIPVEPSKKTLDDKASVRSETSISTINSDEVKTAPKVGSLQ